MTVPDFPPGRVLAGKYALFGAMARTPWSATYRATVGPGQEVVVKVLDAALADQPALLDAIVRAGSAASAVPQPPALTVLEHGKDPESGALFVATRMSGLPSLASLIERGPLPPDAVIAFVRGLAQALDVLHAARLAHLALKPTNVFLGPAPGYPVEVGDFGANAIRALAPDEMRQSFSAPWLAPEQIANDSVAGPSSDVFATALLAFAAFTGKSFWRSCSGPVPDTAGWRAEVIAPPARASQRAAELGTSLGPAFDAVFSRALSVPRDRFTSAGELAGALSDAWNASRAGASNPPPQMLQGTGGPGAGLPYAATLPRPEGAPMFAPGAGGSGGGPGQGGMPAPQVQSSPPPAFAVDGAGAAPSLSPPMSVAGVPKKGGKTWLLVVVAALVLLGAGVGLFLFQRARAASLASGSTAASAAISSASAAPTPSAMASSEPAIAPGDAAPLNAAATASAEPAAVAAADAAAAPAASATATEPSAPATAAQPTSPATAVADNPPSAPPTRPSGGEHPASTAGANTTSTGGSAAPTTAGTSTSGHKKPCGKFLERCPDSGS